MHSEAYTASDWANELDEHSVQAAALDAGADSDLISLLRSRSEWTVDFDDGETVILVRRGDA